MGGENREEASEYPSRKGPWRCFHCNELFTTEDEATLHFGRDETSRPICTLGAAYVRDLEFEVKRYREEDTELHRQIHVLNSRRNREAMKAEEWGYTRGLEDGMKFGSGTTSG